MNTKVHPEDFDHHSDDCNADPVAYYREFREQCPIGRSDEHGGFWFTTKYSDVVSIARDDARWSSERATAGVDGVSFVIPVGPGLEQYPIELDPPRAEIYRDLIDPLLTKDAVEKLRPMVRRHVTRVVDDFIEHGACDLVTDLTNPVPTAVTLEWLGFPVEDWSRLAGPVHDIFAAPPDSARARRGVEGLAYLEQRVRLLLAERRITPREDALSVLAAAVKPDGSLFDIEELVRVSYLLVAGGVDTTTSLTGSTLAWLAEHPDERQRLIDDAGLLPVATEEFLRVFAPSQSMARTATTATEVGGCPVSAGERVLIPWVAANHDPEVFPDPETVQLDRNPRRHLSFGTGAHRCAGAHLARLMFSEMMDQVLTRLPDYAVEGLVPYPTRGNQAGWDHIPATFTPGPRVGSEETDPASGAVADLQLVVSGRAEVADDVVELVLASAEGQPLPAWEPGAHLEVVLPSGRRRQYSLHGDPTDADSYRVGVLREQEGRGGSEEVHGLTPGTVLTVRGPRNHFRLVEAPAYLLIAGGIGVTPLLAMARWLVSRGAPVTVVYGGRSRRTMAYLNELGELLGDQLQVVDEASSGLIDVPGIVTAASAGTAIYCCGPAGLINAVEAACTDQGRTEDFHCERFTSSGQDIDATGAPFEVVLARTGATLDVPGGRRLIDVLRERVPDLPYDCEEGYCGACLTRVVEGTPDHRDSVLTPEERAASDQMIVCVGRACGDRLVLDL